MLRKRNEYPSIVTEKGTVAWASIDEPDYEYKEGGEFHIRVRFDPEDVVEVERVAQELLDEAFEAKTAELKREKKGALLKKLHKKDPVLPLEEDRETGEPTGKVIIRAGRVFKVEVKNGPNAGKVYEFYPDVFDAKGKQLRKRPKIGPGSVVKLSVLMKEYYLAKDGEMGISFELQAVQIIKLVQGGSRDAASYGFAEEEGDSLADDSPFDEEEGFNSEDADDDSDF